MKTIKTNNNLHFIFIVTVIQISFYSLEVITGTQVKRFSLYDNCVANNLSVDGITQDLDYEIDNLTCLNLNCAPHYLPYRIYLKNEVNPILTICEVRLVKVLYPEGCQVTVRLGKVITGYQPVIGMYFAESQIISKSTFAECEEIDGLKQTSGLQMLAFGDYINQTCLSSEINPDTVPYLIGDRKVFCLGDQTTKYNKSLTYPHSFGHEISSARTPTTVHKTEDLDYCMCLFNGSSALKSISLNVEYMKLLSCDSDFVEVPDILNYTAVTADGAHTLSISVQIIYQNRITMFGLNVLLYMGRVIGGREFNNQYLISVSIFTPTERIKCLTEPHLDSIDGSTKVMITDLLTIKQYIRKLRLLRNLSDIFANIPPITLCCGSTVYSYTPGLSDGTISCPSC